MMYYAWPPKFAYELAKILPSDHKVRTDFEDFTKEYGQHNAHTITIAVQDPNFFNVDHIRNWDILTKNIESLKNKMYTLEDGDIVRGVDSVISITNLPILDINQGKTKFFIKKRWYYSDSIEDQQDLNIRKRKYDNQRIYNQSFYNKDSKSSIILVIINKKILESKQRDELVSDINSFGSLYQSITKNDLKFSGLPYIRTTHSVHVKDEVFVFILLTLMITSLIIFLFFRSLKSTIVSMIVVIVGVIYSFGVIGILQDLYGGFQINALMALVPPVIIVIGVPNCIFLINKYHTEYRRTKDKNKSLDLMIRKIGNITLLTNITTASGFAAFALTESESLQEFGIVAAISISLIFLLSLFIIPIWFSFMSVPKERHTRHLDKRWIKLIVTGLGYCVKERRKLIYLITCCVTILAILGLYKVKTTGNITDDISKSGDLYQDLKFSEEHFGGVMPLEVIIETKYAKDSLDKYNIDFMRKIQSLQDEISKYKEFSKPLSYIESIKYAHQIVKFDQIRNKRKKKLARNQTLSEKELNEYDQGSSNYYTLINIQKLLPRIKSFYDKSNIIQDIEMDNYNNSVRISLRMNDLSTPEMDTILTDLQPKIDSIFDKEQYNVIITGTSRVFLEGTKFLVKNLSYSLLLVIFLISIFMAWMFRSARMVLISLVPNLIPLLITAGIMGFFEIPIKPSTILVFSIAFGISVDDTIHFLAKYRQELINTNWNIRDSVFRSLKETGVSMIYTSIVLFFGFFIFVASDFGGTVALGLLVSITLLVAMLSNLLLLPAFLLSLERLITTKSFKEPLIDIFDQEEEDKLLKN